MKVHEHLSEDTKKQLNYQPPPEKQKKPKEHLSKRDLDELMGTKRPKYSKHRGAYRQR